MRACTQNCSVIDFHEGEIQNCVAYCQAKAALRTFFGYDSFRPGQLAVLLPALHGRDVLAKMATGSGKSLCFFLVPLATSPAAVGVIISPLNALMVQQVILMYLEKHVYCMCTSGLGTATPMCWNFSIACNWQGSL